MKIDPTVLGFSGIEVKNWPLRRPRRRDGRRVRRPGSRLARVLGGGNGGIFRRGVGLIAPAGDNAMGAQYAKGPDRPVREKPSLSSKR
jgi:hypothetical protein